MMQGSDMAKYGDLMKGFVNQYSLKNDQYPKKMTEVIDALSKHPFNDKHCKRQKKTRDRNKRTKKDDDEETNFL